MTTRPASACRPVPTKPVPARRVATSHNCLRHLTPAGMHTDRNGCMWAEYVCAVDGTGYEILLGTDLNHVPSGGAR